MSDITILCKVVDNFGDIGFVYRLAKDLWNLAPENKLRLVVSDLKAFSNLEKKIIPDLSFQEFNGWEIYDWNDNDLCLNAFEKNHPEIILECFQCGRPEWLEKLLFEIKIPETVNIINIDYLTAEDYAETFHKLKSLTRSARVKKVNFMPGFTEKTGGLIMDEPYKSRLTANRINTSKDAPVRFLVFCYDKDYAPVINALSRYQEKIRETVPGFTVEINVAQGKGKETFMDSWNRARPLMVLKELDFMDQNEWDKMLCSMDFLFIRGEDSMSRACVAGLPFIWNAYVQEDNYQLVKVNALLERMRRHFDKEFFDLLMKVWTGFNNDSEMEKDLEENLYRYLMKSMEHKKEFIDFSKSLLLPGNMTENLLRFVSELK